MHEAFNVGSGTGYSVCQAIAKTGCIAGSPVPHSFGPRRPAIRPTVGESRSPSASSDGSRQRDLAAQIEDTLRWRRKMPR